MDKKVRVGILGLGTVGSAIPFLLKEQQNKIEKMTKVSIEIEKVFVRNIASKKMIADKFNLNLTSDISDILENDDIQIVIEVMGGTELAKESIITALKNKKHVITANKDLMAQHGTELEKIAQENKCCLYYEAAVAGGIPILRTISNNYKVDKITSVYGIVNGTTNYMLTQMTKQNWTYNEALNEAQKLGFAESDPKNDVEGIDAAYKMVILTKFCFGMGLDMKQVSTQGITKVTLRDIQLANALGYQIKLLGSSKLTSKGIITEVSPLLVPNNHPLASVENEMNAVFINSVGMEETMYYGPGAGANPTATSILSDLLSVIELMDQTENILPFSSFYEGLTLANQAEIMSKYFLTFELENTEKMIEEIKMIIDMTCSNVVHFQTQITEGKKLEMIILIDKITSQQLKELIDNIRNKYKINNEVSYKLI
ncbi:MULTISPECIES: homoserine dehydrogenase [Vagococcus]|uniref:Homoserine dehydrogenase n=1 Tax=Vagococcus fluvialis bH819 TaxID=1255619 RepID=A0A1X6WT44_9ENTE|nr:MULTISPECIES: homoserine dehydrogenase [Vagococcus]SLM86796.1 Homoserine dehydrogenase [Vagococcus fluvialis bH819]HCM88745.1 homoserine dehydrogenase [Vagococcus sp.]